MKSLSRIVLALALACVAFAWAASPAAGSDGPACPGSEESGAPAAAQAKTMRCLVNYARRRHGLAPLEFSEELHRAATRKSADILRCDSFSHEACGREFTYWMRHFGYLQGDCWRAGENIAWGTGGDSSPRQIFQAWIGSPGHRENILGHYADTGIGMEAGTLEGHGGAHVWTEEFGSRSC